MTPRGTDFERVLHWLGDGTTAEELTQELRELVVRVQQTGKKGVLTLALHVADEGGGVVSIQDKITVRKPEFYRPTRLFDSTPDGLIEPEAVTAPLFGEGAPEVAGAPRPDGVSDELRQPVEDVFSGADVTVIHRGHRVDVKTGEILED